MSNQSPADAPGAGYSIADAADVIGLSGITVLRRVSSGTWPGGRVGRKWLVSRPFVDALVVAITTCPQVNAETFAAEWMARGESAGAVALWRPPPSATSAACLTRSPRATRAPAPAALPQNVKAAGVVSTLQPPQVTPQQPEGA